MFGSLLAPKPHEFIIHISNEYDYVLDSVHQKAVFDAIKFAYWQKTGRNLKVWVVPFETKFEGLFTTKVDAEEGRELQPEDKYVDKGQDIYTEIEESYEIDDDKNEVIDYSFLNFGGADRKNSLMVSTASSVDEAGAINSHRKEPQRTADFFTAFIREQESYVNAQAENRFRK